MHLGLGELVGQKKGSQTRACDLCCCFRALTDQLHVLIYPNPNSSGGIPYPRDPSIEIKTASGPEVYKFHQHSAIIPLKQIEYGVYGDLVRIYPKSYSIYLGGLEPLTPKPYILLKGDYRSCRSLSIKGSKRRDCCFERRVRLSGSGYSPP